MKKHLSKRTVREIRFLLTLFGTYLMVLFLMSGIHIGLIVGIGILDWNVFFKVLVPVFYWAAVAAGLTLFTRKQIQKTYEKPIRQLAEATKKVAEGDFSISLAPMHMQEKTDYIDDMLMNFNKMVKELGSIETLKTDFFSNVSHEIKTPLAVIQNHAELLRREDLNPKQMQYANTIFSASRRLSALITNILKLNKLENQAIIPAKESYDLCAQLAECAVSFQDAWENKGLEFDAILEDSMEISADPALLELVWNNLFSNAIKFTEPGGRITLTETSDEKEIRVSVKDTGCGMTNETKQHIFEKFYQGDTSHATVGNGLGLALALRVLQLNNFQIEVDSEPGKGSTFTVIIPQHAKK